MRLPRIQPGGTQISTTSSTAKETQVGQEARAMSEFGGAVEKSADFLYQKADQARGYVENTQFDLIQSKKDAVRLKYTTGTTKDSSGRVLHNMYTPENEAALTTELKAIDDEAFKSFTSKTRKAQAEATASKNNISTLTTARSEWLKNAARNGDALTQEKLDGMVNSYNGDPAQLAEIDKLLKQAVEDKIYFADVAYEKGKTAKENANFRFAESELATDWEKTKNKYENGEYPLTEKQKLVFQADIDAKERAIDRQKKYEQEKLEYDTDQIFSKKFNEGSLSASDIAKAALPKEEGGVGLSPTKQKTWVNLISDKKGDFQYRKGTNPAAYIRLNEMMESPEKTPTAKLDAIIDALAKKEISTDVFNEMMASLPGSYAEATKGLHISEQNPQKLTKNRALQFIQTAFGLSPEARVVGMRDLNKFASDPNVTSEQIIERARKFQLDTLRSYIPNLDEKPNGAVVYNPIDNTFVRVFKTGDIEVIRKENLSKKETKTNE